MGKKVPVSLPNGRHWERKGDAEGHFQDMLSRHAIGERVLRKEDISDLLALIAVYDASRKPNQSKSGSGINYFEKRQDLSHPGGSSCFYVVRNDGSSIDFSIYRAIDAAARATANQVS